VVVFDVLVVPVVVVVDVVEVVDVVVDVVQPTFMADVILSA
jgi:hypothetical protein